MQSEMYPDKDPEERKTLLRDTCDKMENFSYEKSFTNQDVELFCDRLSKIMIEVKQMEIELAKVKKEFSDKMKPFKVELSELLNKIKFRSVMVTEPVYIFIDYDKNKVGYYTGEGVLVNSRRLRIDEHQRSIMSAARRNDDDEVVEEQVEEETVEVDSEEVQ
jgi:hypothetical protein